LRQRNRQEVQVTVGQLRSFCKHTLEPRRTTKQWLRRLRLAQAEAWLYDGFSTEAVARDLGYWDAAHFCHEFKHERGHAPHLWLAMVRKWRVTRDYSPPWNCRSCHRSGNRSTKLNFPGWVCRPIAESNFRLGRSHRAAMTQVPAHGHRVQRAAGSRA
jgi:AraC-like DNA-binding protein